ncbi:MAG: 3-isopropylmalate dehydrogenase [Gemmatimonas sp.]
MEALIAVLPGDGIGPEVTRAAIRVLQQIAARFGHRFECLSALFGGAAIDVSDSPFPMATRELVERSDAVLLGAVGGPKWSAAPSSLRPEQGLLSLRQTLGTFANIRPVKPVPCLAAVGPLRDERLAGTDLLVVRELTGGAYFGEKRRWHDSDGLEHAFDSCEYTTTEIARVVRIAANLARSRRNHVTSVDKANVLETSRLWRQVTTQVMAAEFPDVRLEHALVDSFAMQLILQPARYDVVVTENLFGDILTDEAAVLAGSIGLLPSASVGDVRADGRRGGIFEPIHGSAPEIAGRNIANPVGAILSAAMLLRHALGLEREALQVEHAVNRTLDDGVRTLDCANDSEQSSSTDAFTDHVLERLRASHES